MKFIKGSKVRRFGKCCPLYDPLILKTERPPVTRARSNDYSGRRNMPDRPASALPRERGRSLAQMRSPARSAVSPLSEEKRT
jgi:hypothetical protein